MRFALFYKYKRLKIRTAARFQFRVEFYDNDVFPVLFKPFEQEFSFLTGNNVKFGKFASVYAVTDVDVFLRSADGQDHACIPGTCGVSRAVRIISVTVRKRFSAGIPVSISFRNIVDKIHGSSRNIHFGLFSGRRYLYEHKVVYLRTAAVRRSGIAESDLYFGRLALVHNGIVDKERLPYGNVAGKPGNFRVLIAFYVSVFGFQSAARDTEAYAGALCSGRINSPVSQIVIGVRPQESSAVPDAVAVRIKVVHIALSYGEFTHIFGENVNFSLQKSEIVYLRTAAVRRSGIAEFNFYYGRLILI